MYDTVLGIDVGLNGYVAIYRNGIEVVPIEHEIVRFRNFIQHYKSISKSMIVYIEKIDFHNVSNPAIVRRMKKLIDHYSEMVAVLKLEDINYREVHPRTWQKHFGLIVKGVQGYDKKKMHRDFLCRTLKFKHVAVNKADAILILKYGLSLLQANNSISNTITLQMCK